MGVAAHGRPHEPPETTGPLSCAGVASCEGVDSWVGTASWEGVACWLGVASWEGVTSGRASIPALALRTTLPRRVSRTRLPRRAWLPGRGSIPGSVPLPGGGGPGSLRGGLQRRVRGARGGPRALPGGACALGGCRGGAGRLERLAGEGVGGDRGEHTGEGALPASSQRLARANRRRAASRERGVWPGSGIGARVGWRSYKLSVPRLASSD